MADFSHHEPGVLDSPYHEPDGLDVIKAARSAGPRRMPVNLGREVLYDRCLGAWLGRSAGCVLGIPVEGWERDAIRDWGRKLGDYPLSDYFMGVPQSRLHYNVPVENFLKGRISFVGPDDDLAYTIIGLHALEARGMDLTSRQLGEEWVDHLPLACTAEELALNNMRRGVWPPDSRGGDNPYSEWIGAAIRADVWGYVWPGNPEKAAEYGYRDAILSHERNGIYGEMFFAAVMAAAYVESDPRLLVEIGLSEIPAGCRLAGAIRDTLEWCAQDSGWEETWGRIMEKYGHYHRVHTINNAALTIMALLYGGGDFTKTISIAVMAGLDTDCNGATAGSILGLVLGERRIPARWKEPFGDRLESYVRGFEQARISDLAERTLRLAEHNLAAGSPDPTG